MSNINDEQITSSALLEQLVYIDNFMSNTSEATPNLDVDGQLSLDLAAFADDSFIFPDADKPKKGDLNDDENDDVRRDFIEGYTTGSSRSHGHHQVNHNNSNGNGSNRDLLLHHRKLDGTHLNGILDKLSPAYSNSPFPHESYQHELGNSGNSSSTNNNNNNNNKGGIVVKLESSEDAINVSELPKVPVPPGAQSSLVAAGLSQNQIDLLAALVAQHQQGKPQNNSPGTIDSSSEFVSRSPVRQHNLLSNFNDGSSSAFKFNDENTPNSTSSNSTVVLGSTASFSRFKADSPPNLSNFNSTQPHPSLYKIPSSETIATSSDFAKTPTSGVGVDLDKRRKNTAASARFRIKKKQKEKEMQLTIIDLSETSRKMEIKIQQLEMENKLLRNLIVEKGSKRSDDELRQLKQRARLSNDKHEEII